MALIPTANRPFLEDFKVPVELRSGTSFTAVVLSWKLPSDRYQSLATPAYTPPVLPTPNSGLALLGDVAAQTSSTNSFYHYALHVLQIPEWLRKFMSRSDRPYCIWSDQGDSFSNQPNMETGLLRAFLARCEKAEDVGHIKERGLLFPS